LLNEMGQNFKSNAPSLLNEVGGALRDHNAPRLHRAAHKLHGTITAFSTVAGAVASELEDLAARGQLEEARPLVERLGAMIEELIAQVDCLSIETLRDQVGNADDCYRTVGP
jgi:two-component system sensor histidine kinase/response regulator